MMALEYRRVVVGDGDGVVGADEICIVVARMVKIMYNGSNDIRKSLKRSSISTQ
jgi:hypothetical protein